MAPIHPLEYTKRHNFNVDGSYEVSDRQTVNAGVGFAQEAFYDTALLSTHNLATLEYVGPERKLFRGEFSFADTESRNIYSAYVQDRLVLGNFTYIAGARFDEYSGIGGTANPRGAVIYNTPWNARMKLMYGEAFRAPSFGELLLKNNPDLIGNPDLQPEKIRTVELAYLQPVGRGTASITYFHNAFSDLVVQVPEPASPTGAVRWVNGGSASSDGFELEGAVRLGEHLGRISLFYKVGE